MFETFYDLLVVPKQDRNPEASLLCNVSGMVRDAYDLLQMRLWKIRHFENVLSPIVGTGLYPSMRLDSWLIVSGKED